MVKEDVGHDRAGLRSVIVSPNMLPPDTRPEAHKVQVDVWRRMGTSGRSRAAAALSESLLETVRAQIVARHPEWSPRDVSLALIRRVHGAELAARANGGRSVPER
jgi:hypothetical protein